jgi:hypothetical protein
MMRTPVLLLLPLLLLAFPATSTAQKKTDRAEVVWGGELNDKKDGEFGSVFGNTDDHVYMTIWVKKEMFVQKMDLNHRRVYQKVVPLEMDKDEHYLERIQLFGDRILVFTSYFNKKEKTNTLYLRTFNAEDMKPVQKLKRVCSLDVERKRAQGGFDVRVSPDDKFLLVVQHLPVDKSDRERVKLFVYDGEMNMNWEQEVSVPYPDNEFVITSIRLANDGSVVILGKKYAEKREAREKRKDQLPTYEYHILVYHGNGAAPEDHTLRVADKFLQDLTFNVGNEGDILCGGFFGNKGTSSIAGVFFLRLDRRTKEIVHSSFNTFDKDFVTSYMTEKEEKKATKQADKKGEEVEMVNFDLSEIIRRDDGGAVMIGEQFQLTVVHSCTTTQGGGQTCRTSYHYYYNDIIVVNVDPNGNIEWAAKVPKRQHSVNDGGYYSSYTVAVKEDLIYLMFNDSGKNLFLKDGNKVEPMRLNNKEAMITLATVDREGRVTREALLSQEKRDAILRPKSCVQIKDDNIFIYATRKKEYRFGTVKFM